MSINRLDDKQILTFMQLTSGKTYTFVGTTGDYSDFMCVTAGMFSEPEAPVTKWCITAKFEMQAGWAYIGLEENYSTWNHAYLVPYGLSPKTLTYINMYSEDFVVEGSYNAFQMTMGSTDNVFGLPSEVTLGVSSESPFQLNTNDYQYEYVNIGGSNTDHRYLFNLSETTEVLEFDESQTQQSSGSPFVFTTQLYQNEQNSYGDNFEKPTIAYGNSTTSSFNNSGELNLIWKIAFNNFDANATLDTGYIDSGSITTTEISRYRMGDTMYRRVSVILPCMSFIQS